MTHEDDGDDKGRGRKRISQACDTCNRRKIKCDGQRPSCSTCRKLSISCSYVRPAKKRGPKMGFIAALSQRLSKIEKQILDASSGPENGPLGSLNERMDFMEHSVKVAQEVQFVNEDGEEDMDYASSNNEGTSSSESQSPAPMLNPPQLSTDYSTQMAFSTEQPAQLNPFESAGFMDFLGNNRESPIENGYSGTGNDLLVPVDPAWNSETFLSNGNNFSLVSDAGMEDFSLANVSAENNSKEIPSDLSFLTFDDAPPVMQPCLGSTSDSPSTESITSTRQASPTMVANLASQNPLHEDVFLFSPSNMPDVSSHLIGRSKCINWTLLEVFFDNIYPMIAIIPKAQFFNWAPMESDFLLNMMYALGAKHEHCHAEGKRYFDAAKSQVLQAMDKPCLSSVHGLYLLTYYCVLHEKSPLISSFLALATKMAFVLRLNREDEIDYDAISYSIFSRRQNVEIVRRLWWSLVVADQMERHFGGESFFIRDEDCQTCLATDDDIAWVDTTQTKYHLWVEPGSVDAQKQIAALSSTAPYYPAFQAPGDHAALLQLCKIDRRIFQFQRKQNTTNLTEIQRAQELQQITASLEALNEKVDSVLIQALEINIAPACLNESHAFWKRMFYHLFYQSLFQDLCRSEFNGCLQTGSSVRLRDTPIFQKISASSNVSSIVVQKFLEQNPRLSYVPPLINYLVFSSGMIQLMGRKLNSDDPAFVAKTTKALNNALQVLTYNGELYNHGVKFAQALRTVMSFDISGDSKATCKAFKAHVTSVLNELKSF